MHPPWIVGLVTLNPNTGIRYFLFFIFLQKFYPSKTGCLQNIQTARNYYFQMIVDYFLITALLPTPFAFSSVL